MTELCPVRRYLVASVTINMEVSSFSETSALSFDPTRHHSQRALRLIFVNANLFSRCKTPFFRCKAFRTMKLDHSSPSSAGVVPSFLQPCLCSSQIKSNPNQIGITAIFYWRLRRITQGSCQFAKFMCSSTNNIFKHTVSQSTSDMYQY
jgi:hypothetical protein